MDKDPLEDAFMEVFEMPSALRRQAIRRLLEIHYKYVLASLGKQMRDHAVEISDWLVPNEPEGL